jgi:hypothetical protein
MHLSTLVEMVESGLADRVLLGSSDAPVTGADLAALARRGAAALQGYSALVFLPHTDTGKLLRRVVQQEFVS